jgi:hypothetical protein
MKPTLTKVVCVNPGLPQTIAWNVRALPLGHLQRGESYIVIRSAIVDGCEHYVIDGKPFLNEDGCDFGWCAERFVSESHYQSEWGE